MNFITHGSVLAFSAVAIPGSATLSEGDWQPSAAHQSALPSDALLTPHVGSRSVPGGPTLRSSVLGHAVQSRLVALSQLPPDWDSYGARAVQHTAIQSALRFLAWIPDAPIPAVVPVATGGVQVEWHLPGLDIELEFQPDGRMHLFACDSEGEQDVPVTLASPDLRRWILQLLQNRS